MVDCLFEANSLGSAGTHTIAHRIGYSHPYHMLLADHLPAAVHRVPISGLLAQPLKDVPVSPGVQP